LLKGCTALTGKKCIHISAKCINCNRTYFSNSNYCLKGLEILEKIRKERKEGFLKLQESRKKIAVIIPFKSTIISEDIRENNIEMHFLSA
jgi:hypothetical protein